MGQPHTRVIRPNQGMRYRAVHCREVAHSHFHGSFIAMENLLQKLDTQQELSKISGNRRAIQMVPRATVATLGVTVQHPILGVYQTDLLVDEGTSWRCAKNFNKRKRIRR